MESSEAGSDSHGFPHFLPLPRVSHREAPPRKRTKWILRISSQGPELAGLAFLATSHTSKTMPPWAHPSEMANPQGREGHGTQVTEFTLNTISYRWARGAKNNQPFPQGNFLKTDFLKGEKLQNPCILTVRKPYVHQRKKVQAFYRSGQNVSTGDLTTFLWPLFCVKRDRVRG